MNNAPSDPPLSLESGISMRNKQENDIYTGEISRSFRAASNKSKMHRLDSNPDLSFSGRHNVSSSSNSLTSTSSLRPGQPLFRNFTSTLNALTGKNEFDTDYPALHIPTSISLSLIRGDHEDDLKRMQMETTHIVPDVNNTDINSIAKENTSGPSTTLTTVASSRAKCIQTSSDFVPSIAVPDRVPTTSWLVSNHKELQVDMKKKTEKKKEKKKENIIEMNQNEMNISIPLQSPLLPDRTSFTAHHNSGDLEKERRNISHTTPSLSLANSPNLVKHQTQLLYSVSSPRSIINNVSSASNAANAILKAPQSTDMNINSPASNGRVDFVETEKEEKPRQPLGATLQVIVESSTPGSISNVVSKPDDIIDKNELISEKGTKQKGDITRNKRRGGTNPRKSFATTHGIAMGKPDPTSSKRTEKKEHGDAQLSQPAPSLSMSRDEERNEEDDVVVDMKGVLKAPVVDIKNGAESDGEQRESRDVFPMSREELETSSPARRKNSIAHYFFIKPTSSTTKTPVGSIHNTNNSNHGHYRALETDLSGNGMGGTESSDEHDIQHFLEPPFKKPAFGLERSTNTTTSKTSTLSTGVDIMVDENLNANMNSNMVVSVLSSSEMNDVTHSGEERPVTISTAFPQYMLHPDSRKSADIEHKTVLSTSSYSSSLLNTNVLLVETEMVPSLTKVADAGPIVSSMQSTSLSAKSGPEQFPSSSPSFVPTRLPTPFLPAESLPSMGSAPLNISGASATACSSESPGRVKIVESKVRQSASGGKDPKEIKEPKEPKEPRSRSKVTKLSKTSRQQQSTPSIEMVNKAIEVPTPALTIPLQSSSSSSSVLPSSSHAPLLANSHGKSTLPAPVTSLLAKSPSAPSHTLTPVVPSMTATTSTTNPSSSTTLSIKSLPPQAREILLNELKLYKDSLDIRFAEKRAMAEKETIAHIAAVEAASERSALLAQEAISSREALQIRLTTTETEVELFKDRARHVFIELLRSRATLERKAVEITLHERRLKLGRVVVLGEGMSATEIWEDGLRVKEVASRLFSLAEEKNELEIVRKRLQKKRVTMNTTFPSTAMSITMGTSQTSHIRPQQPQTISEEAAIEPGSDAYFLQELSGLLSSQENYNQPLHLHKTSTSTATSEEDEEEGLRPYSGTERQNTSQSSSTQLQILNSGEQHNSSFSKRSPDGGIGLGPKRVSPSDIHVGPSTMVENRMTTDGFLKPSVRGPNLITTSSHGTDFMRCSGVDYSLSTLRGPFAESVIAEMNPQEVNEVEELCKSRLAIIRRDTILLQQEQDDLEMQKRQLMKAERLFLDEAASKFCSYPVVDRRYLFLELLGKGGFSEVFRAFDLVELRYVACKLHELEANWPEDRRKSYLRHVIRESSIQRTLSHPRFVKLLDVFKMDRSTLVTVLDLCEGGDLDQYLKEREVLPEREARVIISQVFSGLKYLNEQKQRVIHYDLKPANILFHKGEVQISDFGLSKRLTEKENSIELTSQGAGTLSYLPPECLMVGTRPPSISSSVDVWSCGIILFQMLYGKRPFGPPLNNVNVADAVFTGVLPLEFPSKPAVSESAKDFIRRCLSVNPAGRPDVLDVLNDPFFKSK